MKSSRRTRIVRSAAAAALLVALHVTLAPWTAQRIADVWRHMREWRAHRVSLKYISALKAEPPQKLDSLVECAVAFRDHLAKRNVKLVVVLRPATMTLLAQNGSPQSKTTASGAALLQAEVALKEAHVDAFSLLPPLHEALCLRPENAVTATDGRHLGKPVQAEICRILGDALSERQLHKAGRDILFAGDCYAYTQGEAFRSGNRLPHVRVLWRNAGSQFMPDEIARLPDEELEGIRQVMWFVTDEIGGGLAVPNFPSFPSPEALSRQPGQTRRTVKVTLTRPTAVPPDLGKDSPYADALAGHEFRTADGEVFLGLIEVMKNHRVDPATNWGKGEPLLLTIVTWESAAKASPALSHEQILDDAPNFILPRYYISRWLHAP